MANKGYILQDSNNATLGGSSGTLPTTEGASVLDTATNSLYTFSNGIGGWVERILYSNTNTKVQSGIVTDQSISPTTGCGTKTMPANWFKAGKRLRFIMRGFYTTDAAPGNATITIKMGSTTWRTTGSFALDMSVTNGYWRMEGAMTCRTTGVTGTVAGTTVWEHEQSAGASQPFHIETMNTTGDVTFDTTQSFTFDVLWTATDAGTSITCTDLLLIERC